jgi:hypothetical protein
MAMNHMLQNRAHAAKVAIESARTPMEKHNARQDGLKVRDDLQKQIADDTALAVFKTAQPQTIAGAWSRPAGVYGRTRRHPHNDAHRIARWLASRPKPSRTNRCPDEIRRRHDRARFRAGKQRHHRTGRHVA